jgi:hypothetical protein
MHCLHRSDAKIESSDVVCSLPLWVSLNPRQPYSGVEVSAFHFFRLMIDTPPCVTRRSMVHFADSRLMAGGWGGNF